MHPLVIYLIGISVVTLLAYGWDKVCAMNDWHRVPEIQLLGASVAGGGLAGLVAMLLFRHKIRKPVFFAAQAVGIVVSVGLLVSLK
jgi:uncharacterized membrane protein YsdA (DUF1294 family)